MYFLDSMFGLGGRGADRRAAGPDPVGAGLDPSTDLVDHRVKVRPLPPSMARHPCSPLPAARDPPLLVYFALLAATTVGIQQFAVPAWTTMFRRQ